MKYTNSMNSKLLCLRIRVIDSVTSLLLQRQKFVVLVIPLPLQRHIGPFATCYRGIKNLYLFFSLPLLTVNNSVALVMLL